MTKAIPWMNYNLLSQQELVPLKCSILINKQQCLLNFWLKRLKNFKTLKRNLSNINVEIKDDLINSDKKKKKVRIKEDFGSRTPHHTFIGNKSLNSFYIWSELILLEGG